MNCWFLVSLIRRRNDVVDVAWGLGFVLLAWTSALLSGDPGTRAVIANTLVSIWGIRLAWHIHARNHGRPEDYRYLQWRREWGRWMYLRSYFQVFMLQGVLLFIVALPVVLINNAKRSDLGWLDVVGVGIWLLGFFFEAVGDAQLARFIKDPANRGKVMQSGLWAYTRHPNYFGEVTQWWGLWVMALSASNGWIGLIGPITITVLILKVSGIPMLEKKLAEKPEFAEYSKRVSAFLPRPRAQR